MDLTVLIPAINEAENLRVLVPRIKTILGREGISYEVLVIDGRSTDDTAAVCENVGARMVPERRRGYAGALETGFAEAQGEWILKLDADQSHDPDFIPRIWRARDRGDIVIASRYVRGGVAYTDFTRKLSSLVMSGVLRRVLSLPVRDVSSGYRLYRRRVTDGFKFESTNFEAEEEILVRAYAQGFNLAEVPFTYFPRVAGASHAKLLKFGWSIAKRSAKLWKLRNSLDSADYDERGFYSVIPIQRWWHRRRHKITVSWARGADRVLDAGCGSSLIVQSLNNVVGMDFNFSKLRFLSRYQMPLVRGSAFALPFRDSSFDCVISSQVIEHIPFDEVLFSEMRRVLTPGGKLILGTPDYATRAWRTIEPVYGFLMPGGYKDEHITHYTRERLTELLTRNGFSVDEVAYIGGGELIMRCRRDELPATTRQTPAAQTDSTAA
ncbi:MAG TPA: glycosyltransferase [Candidatus Binataceae bacterium]|nr:glycosyltransferase [Candidatus Binataceae bacterium]